MTDEERKAILKKAGIEPLEVKPTDIEVGIADLELQANDVPSRIALLQVKALSEIANSLADLNDNIKTLNQDTNY